MTRILIGLIMLLISLPVASASNSEPKILSSEFRILVPFGEKTTQFNVWRNRGENFYSKGEGQEQKVKALSEKNFQFLNAQSREIASQKGSDIHSCPRANIQLFRKNKYVFGSCIGLKDQTTKRLVQLVNILAMLPE